MTIEGSKNGPSNLTNLRENKMYQQALVLNHRALENAMYWWTHAAEWSDSATKWRQHTMAAAALEKWLDVENAVLNRRQALEECVKATKRAFKNLDVWHREAA